VLCRFIREEGSFVWGGGAASDSFTFKLVCELKRTGTGASITCFFMSTGLNSISPVLSYFVDVCSITLSKIIGSFSSSQGRVSGCSFEKGLGGISAVEWTSSFSKASIVLPLGSKEIKDLFGVSGWSFLFSLGDCGSEVMAGVVTFEGKAFGGREFEEESSCFILGFTLGFFCGTRGASSLRIRTGLLDMNLAGYFFSSIFGGEVLGTGTFYNFAWNFCFPFLLSSAFSKGFRCDWGGDTN